MSGEEAKLDDRQRAQSLVAEGLEHYGRNDIRAAVDCWRRAVELDSANQRALDYLDAAGFEPVGAPSGAQVIDISTARRILTPLPPSRNPGQVQAERMRELERLLEGKRYEDALELLLRARLQSPEDPAISRGIRLIKDRLLLGYVRRLGDLDHVPVRGESAAPEGEVEISVYSLVDGIASVEDILQSSPHGRFETYRCLTRLLDRSAITLSQPAAWSLPVSPPPTHSRKNQPASREQSRLPTEKPPAGASSVKEPAPAPNPPSTGLRMTNIAESLQKLNDLDGFVGASLVDSDSGMVLGIEGGSTYNLELASALNTDVVRAKRKAMDALGLGNQIDDILITLKEQYHIIRPVTNRPQVFMYLVTDRAKSNLALSRLRLAEVDKLLKV